MVFVMILIADIKGAFTISFFFSSRRRHTRSKRDWSSDVCSSDLELQSDFLQILKFVHKHPMLQRFLSVKYVLKLKSILIPDHTGLGVPLVEMILQPHHNLHAM